MRGGSLGNHVQELINGGRGSDGTEGPISQGWPDLPPFIISEAPQNMRQQHPQAYKPTLVSIGPVHHSDEGLLPMIQDKLRFYLRLSEQLYGSRDIDNDIKRKADNLAHKAKSCYDRTYGLTDSDFGLMLALDACFILELFRYAKQGVVVDDPIFRTRWMLPAIRLDLIKFGNQLPFPVLEALYDLTSSGNEPPLTELAANFLAPLVPSADDNPLQFHNDGNRPAHLLALFHSTFSPMPPANSSVAISDTKLSGHKACSVLRRQGISLKQGRGGLLDIKFQPIEGKQTLEIPSLVISHETLSIFRNLVAYEQCNRSVPSYFSYYIAFLVGLVHSLEDIEALCDNRILNHTLATHQQVLAELNTLPMGVVYEEQHNCHLQKVIQDIDIYTKLARHKWIAELKRIYFPTPDDTYTFLGAYLAFVQTFFGILSAIRSSKSKNPRSFFTSI